MVMATTFLSLYPYNPFNILPFPSSSHASSASSFLKRRKFTVLSAHSNPKILKTNRKSPYGKFLSPYDSDEDDEEMDFEDDEDEDEDVDDDFDDDDDDDDVSFVISMTMMKFQDFLFKFCNE